MLQTKIMLHSWLLLIGLSTTLASHEPDLPLCPTHLQFFPQKLPMHCRMPRNADREAFPDLPQYPTLPPLPESYFQSPSPDKQPPPIPIHIPPFPGMPGGMPMPGQIGGSMEGPMPGMPGPMPLPMPVPIVGGPPHKLPIIVMPFYSQDHSFKKPQPEIPPKHRDKKKKTHKKKKKHYDIETKSSSCEDSESESSDRSSSSEHGFWIGRRKLRRKMARRSNKQHRTRRTEFKNKRKDLLTPILQYVTKDGYVIFEKKISKNEAKDWLKSQTEKTEVVEQIKQEKPEEKHQEDELFNPKSAEEFFKLDEEEKRLKAMEMREPAEIEVTTKQGKRQHRHLKFNALLDNKKSNES